MVSCEVKVIEHGALWRRRGEQHGLDIGVHAAVRSAAAGNEAAGKAALFKIRDVRRGEALDTLAVKPLIGERIKTDRAAEHDLSQRVKPGNVRRRVCLGIAELLRIRERSAVIKAAALHGVEHIIRRAVEDAAEALYSVTEHCEREVMQERHTAAAGRAEQKCRAVLPRDLC